MVKAGKVSRNLRNVPHCRALLSQVPLCLCACTHQRKSMLSRWEGPPHSGGDILLDHAFSGMLGMIGVYSEHSMCICEHSMCIWAHFLHQCGKYSPYFNGRRGSCHTLVTLIFHYIFQRIPVADVFIEKMLLYLRVIDFWLCCWWESVSDYLISLLEKMLLRKTTQLWCRSSFLGRSWAKKYSFLTFLCR